MDILALLDQRLPDLDSDRHDDMLKLTYISEKEILTQTRKDEQEYCRAWTKLGKQQKINRLMEYTHRISDVYGLSQSEQGQLKKMLIENMNGDVFHDVDSVDYDQDTGTLLRISNLQRDSASGEFYISIHARAKPPASPGMVRQHIPKVKPLAFDALKSAERPR